jgi:hypothetical protein
VFNKVFDLPIIIYALSGLLAASLQYNLQIKKLVPGRTRVTLEGLILFGLNTSYLRASNPEPL